MDLNYTFFSPDEFLIKANFFDDLFSILFLPSFFSYPFFFLSNKGMAKLFLPLWRKYLTATVFRLFAGTRKTYGDYFIVSSLCIGYGCINVFGLTKRIRHDDINNALVYPFSTLWKYLPPRNKLIAPPSFTSPIAKIRNSGYHPSRECLPMNNEHLWNFHDS